ncbi:MAG: DUF6880 family protein [Sedimenticolaceae bacterium]
MMTRKPRAEADPLEQEIELALSPDTFIPDSACFSFASDLDAVAARIANLTANDPSRTATLYETFLAASYAKIEEVDDSSGSFGLFVDELYCGWIEARQREGANPEETASRLLTWMDEDEYGFCYGLEKHVAKVFDKANLAAFVTQIRARFDAAAKAVPTTNGAFKGHPEYFRRHWGDALRTLYAAQKDVAAYIALAEETGLTAQDCHAIATLLLTRRKPQEALSWVDRGINLDMPAPQGSMAGHDLAKLRRDILAKLGRGDEALAAAWADYCEHPSKYSYDELMKFVPKVERTKWHEKAMAATMGADLHAAMDLLVATRELERLAEFVRQASDHALEGLSHYTTEPVAEKLEKTHPGLAARLWCAQGLRIVNAGKSKYYDSALLNFESAKRCFERAGLVADWKEIVSQVRADHHRKRGFMPGFERLVAGSGPSAEPSFLDAAKTRWNERERRRK